MNKELLDNLFNAVSNGRTDIVRSLLSICETGSPEIGDPLESTTQLLMEPINSTGTLLHIATDLDHVDIVRTLLSSGAHPNCENQEGYTAVDLIRSLAMKNVFIDDLLKCAAKSEVFRICNIIKSGVDVNSFDSPESRNTALHWAVCFGKPEAVECLLNLGASPNILNGQGVTPLHEGVKRKNAEIIKLLLLHGADTMLKCSQGKYMDKSPLDLAENNPEISALLAEYSRRDSESDRSLYAIDLDDQNSRDQTEDLNNSIHSLSMASDKGPNITPQSPKCPPVFLSSTLQLVTDSKLHLVWPVPQKLIQMNADGFKLLPKLSVQIVLSCSDFSTTSVVDCWSIHEEKFKSLQHSCVVENITESVSEATGDILCHINPLLFPKIESYKLIITDKHIRILASDAAALHYALCTLEQLFALYHEDEILPSLFIHDWPEFQHRAVLLDFSIGARKPNLETLKGYIKIMSSLKVKQIHCYFRYEQTVLNNPPFSSREFIELLRFCSQHFITLIPALDVVASEKQINVKDCITEPAHRFMSLFCSKSVHIGPNLSKILLQEVFTTKNSKNIWDMLLLPTSTLIYLYYSSNLQNIDWLHLLPLNCVLIDYGYQVEHDYDLNVKIISHSGCNSCIALGTSSWGSIAGSPNTAITCAHKAATTASMHSSSGIIVCDWQTSPHHPAFCFSWPDILLALGLAWNSGVHEDYLHIRLTELLNLFVYEDSDKGAGYLTVELGRLETFMHESIYKTKKESSLSVGPSKGSVVNQILVDPDAVVLDHVTNDLLQQMIRQIKKFELDLQKANPLCFQHGELVLELRLAMDLFLFACRLGKVLLTTGQNPNVDCGLAVINVGIANLPPIARTDLANKLLALIEQFRAVWLSRNQSCGLQASLSSFNTLLRKLIPDCDESFISMDQNLTDFQPSPNGNGQK